MIVAIYVESITSMLPVKAVTRIDRITPARRDSRRSKQEEYSFASMLQASMRRKSNEDSSNGFDARA